MASQHKRPEQPGLIPHEPITRAILLIRGQKVMLDSDLAGLYEAEIKTLNRAVRRNLNRFPADFMFQLAPEEMLGGASAVSIILSPAWAGAETAGIMQWQNRSLVA